LVTSFFFFIFRLIIRFMQSLIRQIQFYFTYHRKDKYGIIVLLFFCGFLLVAPEIYYLLVAKQKIIDHINITNENFEKLIAKFEAARDTVYIKDNFEEIEPIRNIQKPININIATATQLTQLKGIGEVFSKRIAKYRNSKNGFDNIEDLKNVYGITDSLYQALLPRISFTATQKSTKKKIVAKNNSTNSFAAQKPSYKKNKAAAPVIIVDINTATATELKQLKGIGKVLSERIVKFRKAMGGFDNIEQLNEVYGIEDSLYLALLANIEMSKVERPVEQSLLSDEDVFATTEPYNERHYAKEKPYGKEKYEPPKNTKPKVIVDINKANAAELEQLNGIGNFRAKAIVEHREKLGGFYDIAQLKEVYSFTDSLFTVLKPQLSISASEIQKININTVEFKALLKHPYFDYNLTKNLVNFRENRKGLKNLEELKESYLIDDELYKKLVIYLTVE